MIFTYPYFQHFLFAHLIKSAMILLNHWVLQVVGELKKYLNCRVRTAFQQGCMYLMHLLLLQGWRCHSFSEQRIIFLTLIYLFMCFLFLSNWNICLFMMIISCFAATFPLWSAQLHHFDKLFLGIGKLLLDLTKHTTVLQAVFHHLKLNFLDSKIPACLQRCCGILCQSLAKIKANYIHSSHFIHKSNFSIIKDNQVVQAFIIV